MSKLNGINVLVTRPTHQSEHLCGLIDAEGGESIPLPVINIVDIEDKSALLNCRAHVDELDMAIFISVNAVDKTLPILLGRDIGLPPQLQVVAVGKRTADRLNDCGLTTLCAAPPFNSEAVLEMPQLQTRAVSGKNIVIFRGEGGRELLADTLRQRGAIVNYLEVYRRVLPPTPTWIADVRIDIIIVTSVEGLKNLFTMLDGQAWLRQTPLVVMSERIRSKAENLGVQAPVFVASTASDKGLLAAVLQAALGV